MFDVSPPLHASKLFRFSEKSFLTLLFEMDSVISFSFFVSELKTPRLSVLQGHSCSLIIKSFFTVPKTRILNRLRVLQSNQIVAQKKFSRALLDDFVEFLHSFHFLANSLIRNVFFDFEFPFLLHLVWIWCLLLAVAVLLD